MGISIKKIHKENKLFETTESEWEKDIWDARKIPGARYPLHYSKHFLKFTDLPIHFKPYLKSYMRFLLINLSIETIQRDLRYLKMFVSFFISRYPASFDFKNLSIKDIEDFVSYLNTRYSLIKSRDIKFHLWTAITALKKFLQYLKKAFENVAPIKPINSIIWPEHRGKRKLLNPNEIKYISTFVLSQIDDKLHYLPKHILPIVFLLRVSGWRISDVLNLKYDSCLEYTSLGTFLCGDISKSNILNHKIPITNQVATFIESHREFTKTNFSEQQNPNRYLFPSNYVKRIGLTIPSSTVRYTLNKFVVQHNICDESGKIFHIKTHAFRHTKAVELINNGMDLMYVQKWLAHLSPQMTLVYAKILDSTMYKQWQKVMENGAITINLNGFAEKINPETLLDNNNLELLHVRNHLDSRRLPMGYCFKHKNFDCPAADTPCYRCHCFVTTPEFLPQFEKEINDTNFQIELGEKSGHQHWVDANRRKLPVLTNIVNTLKEGVTHQPMEKHKREYSVEELSQKSK